MMTSVSASGRLSRPRAFVVLVEISFSGSALSWSSSACGTRRIASSVGLPSSARGGRPDRIQQPVARFVLGDKGEGARPSGLSLDDVVVVDAQHNYGYLASGICQRVQDGQAVHARHLVVEDHDVRLE